MLARCDVSQSALAIKDDRALRYTCDTQTNQPQTLELLAPQPKFRRRTAKKFAQPYPAWMYSRPGPKARERMAMLPDAEKSELLASPCLFNWTAAVIEYGAPTPLKPQRPFAPRKKVIAAFSAAGRAVARAGDRRGFQLRQEARNLARFADHEVPLEAVQDAIETTGLSAGVAFPEIDAAHEALMEALSC